MSGDSTISTHLLKYLVVRMADNLLIIALAPNSIALFHFLATSLHQAELDLTPVLVDGLDFHGYRVAQAELPPRLFSAESMLSLPVDPEVSPHRGHGNQPLDEVVAQLYEQAEG